MYTMCIHLLTLDCSVVCCRDFQFSLISGSKLEAMAATQRLQVNAAIATVQLAYGGQLVVETTDLTAQAFKVCPPKMHASHMCTVSDLIQKSTQPNMHFTDRLACCLFLNIWRVEECAYPGDRNLQALLHTFHTLCTPHMCIRPHTGRDSGLYVPDPNGRHSTHARVTECTPAEDNAIWLFGKSVA